MLLMFQQRYVLYSEALIINAIIEVLAKMMSPELEDTQQQLRLSFLRILFSLRTDETSLKRDTLPCCLVFGPWTGMWENSMKVKGFTEVKGVHLLALYQQEVSQTAPE